MDELAQLRDKLLWMEHDLDHVTTERDKAQAKLDTIYAIASESMKGFGTIEDAVLHIKNLARS